MIAWTNTTMNTSNLKYVALHQSYQTIKNNDIFKINICVELQKGYIL